MQWFYLDDVRGVPVGMDAILVSDYFSMVKTIDLCDKYKIPFAISFDHDIGDEYYSGYQVAKYIAENEIPMVGFAIHSMNPVGADNIRQILTHYGYKEIDWR